MNQSFRARTLRAVEAVRVDGVTSLEIQTLLGPRKARTLSGSIEKLFLTNDFITKHHYFRFNLTPKRI